MVSTRDQSCVQGCAIALFTTGTLEERLGLCSSEKWIIGANSVRVSNVHDHVQSEQHAHAMMLLKKQYAKSAGLPPSSYAPIAEAFNRLSDDDRWKLQFKFDIAHFVATEKLPVIKYPQICEPESYHGVNLGASYINEYAGREMIHYTVESRRQELRQKLAKAKFFFFTSGWINRYCQHCQRTYSCCVVRLRQR